MSEVSPRGIKARVRNGRLVVDEPTTLPEGTELDLVAYDGGDELDDEERAELRRALDEADADIRSGRLVAASHVLTELRSRARR
jgi:hypothetical protein